MITEAVMYEEKLVELSRNTQIEAIQLSLTQTKCEILFCHPGCYTVHMSSSFKI